MGYESDFHIKVEPPVYAQRVAEEIKEMTHYHASSYAGVVTVTDCKWSDFVSDLTAILVGMPGVLLNVTRWGEHHGDIERTLIKQGHAISQDRAIVLFPAKPDWAVPSAPGTDITGVSFT